MTNTGQQDRELSNPVTEALLLLTVSKLDLLVPIVIIGPRLSDNFLTKLTKFSQKVPSHQMKDM